LRLGSKPINIDTFEPLSKRFSLAKVEANENFNRWNT
jgi:hypothetical protein